ncbi:MAG: response regulator transcription factor [Oscillospiraceae bacterium]|nr:response regulator transcription factor [Oscillospiraceae bacterium]
MSEKNEKNEKIMIVEDDESIRRLVEVALESHGYGTVSYTNAAEALAGMKRETPPAVAIFDIMLEGMDGVEAVRLMRRDPRLLTVPVIMLTAKDTELDKIVGLDAGADDYMIKPFSVLELCARVRAQIRRSGAPDRGGLPLTLAGGALTLNTATREATLAGNPCELTFKEFDLLRVMMENQSRALSRSELLHLVWGDDYCGESRTLDIHIGNLRQKLGDTAERSRFIKTVRGIGYRFVGGADNS